MRILAVDVGDRRIGVAISDPTGTIGRPLTVVEHVARAVDAAVIVSLAQQEEAERIIVGQNLDEDGEPTPQGRKAARMAEAIRGQTDLPVELWDESGSTQAARAVRMRQGTNRSRRGGHLDDVAAAVILQSYLDALAGVEPDVFSTET